MLPTNIVKMDELLLPSQIIWRGFEGETDYQKILSIVQACTPVDSLERADTLENITNTYSHLVNCDPLHDMLFAEVNGQTVGYCRLWWEISGAGEWIGFILGYVHPAFRGQGIGSRFLTFQENRLKTISAKMLAEGKISTDAHCYADAWLEEGEKAREGLLIGAGYHPERYEYHMVRSLAEPLEILPLPAGLEIRPVLPEHYRQVWDAATEAFRDHWGYIPPSDEYYQQWLEDPNFDPGLFRVAWDGEQVAGMVQNFLQPEENVKYGRKRGYTEGICVRRPWRKRGLARSLLTHSMQMFKDMGMQETALSVDTQNLNGANRIYESVGYRIVSHMTLYRKELVDLEKSL